MENQLGFLFLKVKSNDPIAIKPHSVLLQVWAWTLASNRTTTQNMGSGSTQQVTSLS